jgi:diguanylate cyclase (GGDEF)-like protein
MASSDNSERLEEALFSEELSESYLTPIERRFEALMTDPESRPRFLDELTDAIANGEYDREATLEVLNRLAETARQGQLDLLTGLKRREALMPTPERQGDLVSFAKEADRQQHDLALLIFDLDNFSGINDYAGHAVGDDVLSRIGQTIGETLRPGDEAYRMGGDEFLLLLPQVDHELAAHQVLERISGRFPINPATGRRVEVNEPVAVNIYRYSDYPKEDPAVRILDTLQQTWRQLKPHHEG